MTAQSYHFLDDAPVIPVIAINQIERAIPLAEALVAGGIRNLEITLRTDCALDAIRLIAQEVEGAFVGAGTVCNPIQFEQAVSAGANFVVSPGSSAALFEVAASSVPLLPGAVTASEVMAAREAGFNILKFFPASTSGGAAAIKAFAGPFGDIRFVPTGGINLENAIDYLSLHNVRAVGGSWLTPADAINDERWDVITELAVTASQLGQ